MRLKPLHVTVTERLYFDQVLEIEDKFKQHPNLTAQLKITFEIIALRSRNDEDKLVELN